MVLFTFSLLRQTCERRSESIFHFSRNAMLPMLPQMHEIGGIEWNSKIVDFECACASLFNWIRLDTLENKRRRRRRNEARIVIYTELISHYRCWYRCRGVVVATNTHRCCHSHTYALPHGQSHYSHTHTHAHTDASSLCYESTSTTTRTIELFIVSFRSVATTHFHTHTVNPAYWGVHRKHSRTPSAGRVCVRVGLHPTRADSVAYKIHE